MVKSKQRRETVAMLRSKLAHLQEHHRTFTQEYDQAASGYAARLLHLECVLAKCGRQFRLYAEEHRKKITSREFMYTDRATAMDKMLTNAMMASMCEDALRT